MNREIPHLQDNMEQANQQNMKGDNRRWHRHRGDQSGSSSDSSKEKKVRNIKQEPVHFFRSKSNVQRSDQAFGASDKVLCYSPSLDSL